MLYYKMEKINGPHKRNIENTTYRHDTKLCLWTFFNGRIYTVLREPRIFKFLLNQFRERQGKTSVVVFLFDPYNNSRE